MSARSLRDDGFWVPHPFAFKGCGFRFNPAHITTKPAIYWSPPCTRDRLPDRGVLIHATEPQNVRYRIRTRPAIAPHLRVAPHESFSPRPICIPPRPGATLPALEPPNVRKRQPPPILRASKAR